MLDYIRSFAFWWQLPMIGLFLLGWLGSAWLLRRGVRRQDPSYRTGAGHCILAVIMAGVSAAICGAITFYVVNIIGKAADIDLKIPGAILAGPVALAIAVLVTYAMFALSFRQTLRAIVAPLAAVMLLACATAAAAGLPAIQARRQANQKNATLERLQIIHDVIVNHYLQDYGRLPKKLDDLVEKGLLKVDFLRSPRDPGEPIGFLYLPTDDMLTGGGRRILLCEICRHGQCEEGRAIGLANGGGRWYGDKEFHELLSLSENRDFADALKKLEPQK
ncbi:MAG: hypothetical protein HZA50_13090 [Planctomycetes bacterium]|nr:hypothetical protein [Planctomycetota bacterium]